MKRKVRVQIPLLVLVIRSILILVICLTVYQAKGVRFPYGSLFLKTGKKKEIVMGGNVYQEEKKGVVFLGGSCNPTTWRKDTAIPLLQAKGYAYHNPQVDNWTPDLIEKEAKAKAEADILLFVIDSRTRAIASLVEVTEHVLAKRKVLLVINEIPDGTSVKDQVITGQELLDLNRSRSYLTDMAARNGVVSYNSVEDAISSLP